MFARPFTITPTPRRRRVVGWLSLVVYFAAAFGMPVPEAVAAGPFPCQSHGCGCRSAEQCWRSCCCFTPEEKLSWARRHGVTPPSFAVKETPAASCCSAPKNSKSEPSRPKKSPRGGCCSPRPDEVCDVAAADVHASPKAGSCCSTADHGPVHTARGQRNGGGVVWAPGFNVFRCQGLGSAWMAIVDVIAPPPPLLEYHIALPYRGQLISLNAVLLKVAYAPATPPG